MAMSASKLHYCRNHFTNKETGFLLVVDFGYCSTAQRMESTKKLQEFYPDYSFRKTYAITEDQAFKYDYKQAG